MIPITQTRLHIENPDGTTAQKGNCFQAAVASIMELPLDEVPNFIEYSDEEWFDIFFRFVKSHGYEYKWQYASEGVPKGYSIGSGVSPRARKDKKITHAIICFDGEMVFDVHPDRTGVLGGIYMYETTTKVENDSQTEA